MDHSWREVHPALLIAQKLDFQENVQGDEQEGVCRSRNLIRQHIPAALKNTELLHPCGGLVASFQILLLFEGEFPTPMGVVSQSIPSEHG